MIKIKITTFAAATQFVNEASSQVQTLEETPDFDMIKQEEFENFINIPDYYNDEDMSVFNMKKKGGKQ